MYREMSSPVDGNAEPQLVIIDSTLEWMIHPQTTDTAIAISEARRVPTNHVVNLTGNAVYTVIPDEINASNNSRIERIRNVLPHNDMDLEYHCSPYRRQLANQLANAIFEELIPATCNSLRHPANYIALCDLANWVG